MNGEAIDIAKCPARSLSEIAYLVCRGDWSVAVGQHGDMALEDVGDVCRVAVAEPRGDLGESVPAHRRKRAVSLVEEGENRLNLLKAAFFNFFRGGEKIRMSR